jgi:hypothetical protein
MVHSFGGSTSAELMRVEPQIVAGIDLDGTIHGAAARRGVARPFLVLDTPQTHVTDPTIRRFLKHSTGPRLEISIKGFVHGSFSDLPVLAPDAVSVGKWHASASDIVMQRAYVRAFFARYLLGRRSPLLDAASPRYPRVVFAFRAL